MTRKNDLATALQRNPPPIKRGSDVKIGSNSEALKKENASSPPSPAQVIPTEENQGRATLLGRQMVEETLETFAGVHSQHVQLLIEDILDSHYQTREKSSGPGTEKFQRLVKAMQARGPDLPIKVHPHQTISGKYQITAGGHNRVAAARVAGLTHYPVIIVDYNEQDAALGTAWENLAREDLTPLEEGELYLKIRRSRGYNRDDLATELGVSPDRIKECEALANSSEAIKGMIRHIKGLGNDTNRGLQAAKHLRRLDVLDQRKEGLTARIQAPLIDAFVYEQITTSEVDLATARLIKADDPESVLAALLRSIRQKNEENDVGGQPSPKQGEEKQIKDPPLQRLSKLGLLTRNFRGFSQILGETSPTDEEKQILMELRQQIDALMSR